MAKNKKPSMKDFDADLNTPLPDGFDDDLAEGPGLPASVPTAAAQLSPQEAAALESQGPPDMVIPAPAKKAMSPVEEYFRVARQPLTLGFGDEISAYLASKVSGSPYEDILARERALDARAAREHPIASGVAEIGGAVAAGAAGGLLGAIAYGAGRGAGEGETDLDRVKMGLIGGGIAASFPVAAGAVKGVLGGISKSAKAAKSLLSEGDEVLSAGANIVKKAGSDIFSFFSPKGASKGMLSYVRPGNVKERALEANKLLQYADDPWDSAPGSLLHKIANQSQATKVSRLNNANPEARTSAEKVLKKALESPQSAAVEHSTQMSKNPAYRVAFRKAVDEGAPSTDVVPRGEWTARIVTSEPTKSYAKAPKLSK